MKRLIIVGAGGLGREVETLARGDFANGKEWYIGGFLDTSPDVLDGIHIDAKVIGDPNTFTPAPDDLFVVAIGDPKFKRKVLAPLRLKKADFCSLRPNARIASRAKYGASVFGYGVRVSVDTSIGDFVYIGDETIIGHDTTVSDYAHIGTRCFIAGRAQIGNGAVLHPMSSIAIGVRVGDGATVGLGSVVVNEVPAGATVVGNPARRLAREQ